MSPSEFERTKPTETYKKIKELQDMINFERQKTETLYSNRISMLDKIQESARILMETFQRGD
jgi:hypothetical protein